MHVKTVDRLHHTHTFSVVNQKGERRTLYVLVLTAVTMVIEIIAGSVFGSMALLADGWHMGTHVAAFLIAIFAYRFARKHIHDPAYTFGTGKVTVLGGFTSAVALAAVAVVMLAESLERIFSPHDIQFSEAIIVACIGLFVNIVSAFLLRDSEHHDHGHDHGPTHAHDHNLRAAYIHVLTDAMTSVFAIAALLFGKYLGFTWLDPVMGIAGAVIIARWSWGLITQTGPILLDASIEEDTRESIRESIENDSDNRISDMHIWRVGVNHYAAVISLVTHYPKDAGYYKQLLREFPMLSHITIEINNCVDDICDTEQT